MTHVRASGVALLAALAWGLGNVSQKTVMEHLDGFSATGLACLLGAVVLLPFLPREAAEVRPDTAGFVKLTLKVSVVFAVAATMLQFGFGHTSVTNAGFLVNTATVITPTLAWIWFKQRASPWIWPANLCTLFGALLMAGGSWTGLSFGDALCLISAVAFAFWTLLLGQHVTRYRRPNLLTMLQLLFCGLICVVLGALSYGLPAPEAIADALPELFVIGVFSKGLAYLLNATAQQHISATCAGILVSAESVFGGILAMLLLGESLSLGQGLGAGLIVASVVVVACLPEQLPQMIPGNDVNTRPARARRRPFASG